MKLLHDRYTIHPRVPFAIARSSTTAYDRVRVRLLDDAGVEGWGEAAPNAFYGESADTVIAALPRLARLAQRPTTVGSLHDIDSLEEQMRTELSSRDASVRAAVSAAAHDLLGKKKGEPLWKLFGLEPMLAPPSSFTIAIATDDAELLRRVEEAHRYPILKVKLGSDRDEWVVRTVRRAAPGKLLRADANAAWDLPRATAMAAFLADNGIELLEQPLPKDDLDGLRALRQRSPIPIIADESCLTASDLPRLDGAVDGINIKLSKCGGLAEARRMALEARRREMKVMIGCMIESSLCITAAAHLAPLAHYADLDGAALLKDDPYEGVSIEDGLIRLPSEPGLGVKLRQSL
jgi:L-Ala-D/L-Glu epimerase